MAGSVPIPAAHNAELGGRRAFLARHEYRRTDVEKLGQFPSQGRADLSLAGENRRKVALWDNFREIALLQAARFDQVVQNRIGLGSFDDEVVGEGAVFFRCELQQFSITSPGGHFKFPHLWPGQIPPGRTTGKAGLLLGMGTLCKAAGGFFEAIALAAKLDQHTAVQ